MNPDHITLAVTDGPAAIERLALFGFRLDHVATIDGGVPASYMGMPIMKAEHITLVLDGCDPRFEIQLLVFDPPPAPYPDSPLPTNLRQLGFNHIALRVDDLDATSAELKAKGVSAINEPMSFIGRRLEFFEGPEGITIELVQWLDP